MKKIYQSMRHRRNDARRSRRFLKRDVRKAGPHTKPKEKYRDEREKKYDRPIPPIRIKCPKNFDLLQNSQEVLEVFHQLETSMARNNRIELDHSEVTSISTETLVLLLGHFELYDKRFKNYKIDGILPRDEKAQKLLLSSGFTKYVTFYGQEIPQNPEILEIHTGILAENETASKFNNFALTRLALSRSVASSRNYSMIIECMANTKNHAYQVDGVPIRKWWLVARYDRDHHSMRFSFLDLGIGIPKTVRKKFIEKFGTTKDAELINSALRGDLEGLRSATGLEHRGKGLPRIYSNLRANYIQNLAIMSNKGYLRMDSGIEKKMNLRNKFLGTLISWEFNGASNN